jgi:hypothetical protein
MTRFPALVIALFLAALWGVGLAMHAPIWLPWMNLMGALLAFIIVGMFGPGQADNDRRWLSLGLALGLYGLWIGGLVKHAPPFLTWCTFLAACGTLLIAAAGNTPMVDNTPRAR